LEVIIVAGKANWSYRFYRLAWSALDGLYPPRCGGCGRVGVRWCDDCQQKVVPLGGRVCEKCGVPIKQDSLCSHCKVEMPPYRALRSWAVFESPVREALHTLKYRRNLGLGDALAVPIADFADSLHWPFEVVLPIPLGRKRMEERGYNQVALIAQPFALALEREYRPAALRRKLETRSQVGLSASERHENVRDAFVADPRFIQGKVVLVLDDVATTGSTLSSCAQALFQSGARDVYALTVARALPHHGLNTV
jgi:ComF family protein